MSKPALQQLRRAAGYRSAAAYADHLGLNRATYTDYEQGRIQMPLDKAWLIADDLGVTLDALMGRTPPRKQEESERDKVRRQLYSMLELLEGEGSTDGDGSVRRSWTRQRLRAAFVQYP